MDIYFHPLTFNIIYDILKLPSLIIPIGKGIKLCGVP